MMRRPSSTSLRYPSLTPPILATCFKMCIRDSIYDEPVNAFVADFIGESNILRGTMVRDELVHFSGNDFPGVCLLYTSASRWK